MGVRVRGQLTQFRAWLETSAFLGKDETGERSSLARVLDLHAAHFAFRTADLTQDHEGGENFAVHLCYQPIVTRILRTPDLTELDAGHSH